MAATRGTKIDVAIRIILVGTSRKITSAIAAQVFRYQPYKINVTAGLFEKHPAGGYMSPGSCRD